ncbi:MAG: ATP-grasp domain-containing protein [Gammaproteobacteria bacterium]
MNLLIFEYITGGGLVGEALPASLVSEGELMLNAVANDFTELPDMHLYVLRDYRLTRNQHSEDSCIVSVEHSFSEVIETISDQIDAMLIIAPESANILFDLCETYSNREFILLNSSLDSIQLTSNKLSTYVFLQKHNIAQIPTYEMVDVNYIDADKLIVKPMDGVGCENIVLIDMSLSENKSLNQLEIKNNIVQPYLVGQSASLSLLCWQGVCKLLSVNIQSIQEKNNSLELEQCIVNAIEQERFNEFANSLVKALPGLSGYIGVDILITDNEVLLVEINPRLTTSYAGLKAALGINPAELILRTFTNQKLPEFTALRNTSVVVEVGAEHAA